MQSVSKEAETWTTALVWRHSAAAATAGTYCLRKAIISMDTPSSQLHPPTSSTGIFEPCRLPSRLRCLPGSFLALMCAQKSGSRTPQASYDALGAPLCVLSTYGCETGDTGSWYNLRADDRRSFWSPSTVAFALDGPTRWSDSFLPLK